MNINLLISNLFEYGSILLTVVAVLVFVTNIIVEVIKGLIPKIPTNIVAVIVAMIVTVLALYILCTVLEISVMWYYAAMFGFDKFKAAWEKIKQHKE